MVVLSLSWLTGGRKDTYSEEGDGVGSRVAGHRVEVVSLEVRPAVNSALDQATSYLPPTNIPFYC